jgi:prepilin-type N-terminal cleavage/methylation domain-containing protein
VRPVVIRERFLKEERGFSLPEMLVTIVIMIVVFFALYSVFDMSVRIFMFGSNKVEAVESARLGLERMEREIRAAYPVASDSHLFFSANGLATTNPPQAMPAQNGSQITFGNELGAEGAGDGSIKCGTPCEYITYKLTDDASNAACTVSPCDLRRVNTANSTDPGNPVVDNAVFPGGLEFAYLRSDGTIVDSSTCTLDPPLSACEGEIAKVRVSLEIMVHPGTQTAARQRLTTEIDLRNRQ